MSEKDDSKKKKPKPRKKLTTTLSLSSSNTAAIPKQIEDTLKEALIRFNDLSIVNKFKLKDLQHLDNIVQEFLKAFVILGYDLNGEKVHIFHATCPHDKDALVEHLRSTLVNILNSNNEDS